MRVVPNWSGLVADIAQGATMDGLWRMAEVGGNRRLSAIWKGCDWRESA